MSEKGQELPSMLFAPHELAQRQEILQGELENLLTVKENGVTIGPPIEQSSTPEYGLYNGLLDFVNEVQHDIARFGRRLGIAAFRGEKFGSLIPKSDIQVREGIPNAKHTKVPRPYPERARLFTIHQQFREQATKLASGDKTGFFNLVRKELGLIRIYDRIGDQFIRNQREVTVDFEKLGKVSSRICQINSPVEGAKDLPIAVTGGGYGADLLGTYAAAQEIAALGQDVIMTAPPDSYNGFTTDAFAVAVEKSPGMEAHAAFTKALIRKIKEENPGRQIDLIGHSTFAIVIQHILNDKAFVKEMGIKDAVIIGAAGTVEMSRIEQATQYLSEVTSLMSRVEGRMTYSFVWGSTHERAKDANQNRIRRRIWNAVLDRTRAPQLGYNTMEVLPENHIFSIEGSEDKVTAVSRSTLFEGNSQVVRIVDPKGKHQDAMTDANRLFTKLFEVKKKY